MFSRKIRSAVCFRTTPSCYDRASSRTPASASPRGEPARSMGRRNDRPIPRRSDARTGRRMLHDACSRRRTPISMMRERGDFTAEVRLVGIAGIAIVVGALCSVAAVVLLRLIDLFTNLFYYGTLSLAHRIPADHQLGWWSVLIPAAGGLIIGLMARYGSERIRGHGIPEAMEAILIGKSRMQPKVAVLKPLVVGDFDRVGRPVRRRGADHHDRRVARFARRPGVPSDGRRAEDAAGGRGGRRDVGDLRHADGRRAAGRRAAALRVEAAEPDPRRAGQLRRGPAPPL